MSQTKGIRPQQLFSPSSQNLVVLAVKVLFILLILLLLPKLVDGGGKNRRRNKDRYRNRYTVRLLKKQCLEGMCSAKSEIPPEENMNCLFQCLSPACYLEIFESDPLEFGQVDYDRLILFEKCLKQELRNQKKVSNNRRNQSQESVPVPVVAVQ